MVVAEKVLTDSRDSYDKQKNERKGSLLRAEVRTSRPILILHFINCSFV